MKKLMMMFTFLSLVAIANVSAQSCCAKKAVGASCSKATTTSAATTATTQVAGEAMVRKVACTTEEKAACSKGEKAACCSKTAGAKACAGKVADAQPATTTEKSQLVPLVKNTTVALEKE